MTRPGIEWTPGEAASVNEFLSSPVGMKWLGVLLTHKPKIDMSSTERAAITGAFAAGYESVFGEIAATRASSARDSASVRGIDPTRD
jgi:hypothetical protein